MKKNTIHDCVYRVEGNRGTCIHCNKPYEGNIQEDMKNAKIVDIGREPHVRKENER